MRLLFISTLYPSSVQPARATYSRSLFAAVRALGHDVHVIAPVPWFPLAGRLNPRYRRPPRRESLDGVTVDHPAFPVIPRLLMRRHHLAYRAAVKPCLRRVLREFRPEHVMLGFAYPDAAAMLSLCLTADISCSVQVLGSDFRVRMTQAGFAGIVRKTLERAPLIFCPGEALRAAMVGAGITGEKIVAFRNGVDRRIFHPPSPETAVRSGTRPVLFVGNLLYVKGVDRLAAAWPMVLRTLKTAEPQLRPELLLAGKGELRTRLEAAFGADPDSAGTVRFLGAVPHADVGNLLRSSHCLCLPSRSEGMPNVVIEALACGVPVVATAVGEVPGLVREGVNGHVVNPAADDAAVAEALSSTLVACLRRPWDAVAIAATVTDLTWENAARTVMDAVASRTGGEGPRRHARADRPDPEASAR